MLTEDQHNAISIAVEEEKSRPRGWWRELPGWRRGGRKEWRRSKRQVALGPDFSQWDNGIVYYTIDDSSRK